MYLKGRKLHGTYTNLIQEHANFLTREKPLVNKLLGQSFISETNWCEFFSIQDYF